jgi:simple sugar transport system ATP-binding protein
VGFQQRVEILKLLFRKAEILILDEPTAVLTPQEVETFFELLRHLKSQGKTIILITHKLKEVLALCDEVTVLRQGRVTAVLKIPGPTEVDLVKAMIGREIKPIHKPICKPGETRIAAKDFSVKYGDRGDLKGLHFNIRAGEILGIAGVEGNGQGALIEGLLGLSPSQGQLTYKGETLDQSTAIRRNKFNFGLISEDRHEQSLWMSASIAENCAIGFTSKISRFGVLSQRAMRSFAAKLLEPYGVKMRGFDQAVSELSGGSQQKIIVAREISARKPDFLMASHPTRGVDVGAIEFIHQQILDLRKNGSAILLISSELEELSALSDRILVLFDGRGVKEFQGPHFDLDAIGKAMTSGDSVG